MKSLFVFGPLAFLVCIACVIAQTSSAQREKSYVAIDDIGVRVEVVGRLGVPLRKMTRFKATWIQSPDRSKPESIPLRLKIMEIARVTVERDILFLPTDVVFVNTAGKEVVAHELTGVIDLFGYEDWVTFGPPFEFDKAIGTPVASPPPRGRSQLRAIIQSQ